MLSRRENTKDFPLSTLLYNNQSVADPRMKIGQAYLTTVSSG